MLWCVLAIAGAYVAMQLLALALIGVAMAVDLGYVRDWLRERRARRAMPAATARQIKRARSARLVLPPT